jgi:hypothetical protein
MKPTIQKVMILLDNCLNGPYGGEVPVVLEIALVLFSPLKRSSIFYLSA